RGKYIEVIVWRTGKAHFRHDRGHWLKGGGLTCYTHGVLKKVEKPVHVTEVYLRPPVQAFSVTHDHDDLKKFVEEAKTTAQNYSISEKIKDFPAQPSTQNCRFCPFTSICIEYSEFAEVDYDLETLKIALKEKKEATESALKEVAGEIRP